VIDKGHETQKATSRNNAVVENFFKTLRAECFYQNKFATKEQAALLVFEHIKIQYNHKRLHSALGRTFPYRI